ncbi:MAG: hypothetical protein WC683_01095 [bacterium]
MKDEKRRKTIGRFAYPEVKMTNFSLAQDHVVLHLFQDDGRVLTVEASPYWIARTFTRILEAMSEQGQAEIDRMKQKRADVNVVVKLAAGRMP